MKDYLSERFLEEEKNTVAIRLYSLSSVNDCSAPLFQAVIIIIISSSSSSSSSSIYFIYIFLFFCSVW